MKILYVISRLNNAGPVNQLLNLVKGLDRGLVTIAILTLFEELENTRWDDFVDCGVTDISCLGLKNKKEVFFSKRRAKEFIDTINPDIIHSATLPADILVGLMCKEKYKCMTTLHCNIYQDYFHRFGFVSAKLNIRIHEFFLKKMDTVVCCSKTIMGEYSKGINNKIRTVQNGIAMEEMSKELYDARKLKEKLALHAKKKVILIVGSLDSRKNSLEIIDELNKWEEIGNFQVVFLGEGELLQECKVQAKCSSFIFKGSVDNVSEYLQCTDIYLSLSKSEGLPLSVLEAGSVGIKMILSDIDAHREIANYDMEKSGITFYCLGSGGLGTLVRRCLDRENISREEISEYYQKYFSSRRMADSYFDIYKELISRI